MTCYEGVVRPGRAQVAWKELSQPYRLAALEVIDWERFGLR